MTTRSETRPGSRLERLHKRGERDAINQWFGAAWDWTLEHAANRLRRHLADRLADEVHVLERLQRKERA